MRRMLIAVLSGLVMVLSLPLGAAAAPVISAELDDALLNDVDSDGVADPGDTLQYTVEIENGGGMPATVTRFQLTLDSSMLNVTNLIAFPIAVDDVYTVSANVELPNSLVTINAANGLLSNDVDPDDGGLPGTCAGCTASLLNDASLLGSVVVNANGSFTYTPDPGNSTDETFTYLITDVGGDANAPGEINAVGEVTITFPEVIWFVDNDAGGTDVGTLNNPFNTATALFDAETASSAGDMIFVFTGNTAYDGGITLKNDQKLLGEGVALNIVFDVGLDDTATVEIVSAGTRPVITNTSPGDGITLAANNMIMGLNVGATSDEVLGAGIIGTSVGNLLVDGVDVVSGVYIIMDGGPIIDIDGGDIDVTLGNVSSDDSTTTGIRLINLTDGSNFDVTGTTSIDAPMGDGIVLSSNGSTSTFDFAGAVTITTPTGDGLVASSSGTVNITDATSTISATGGAAVDIDSTNFDLDFASLASTNSASQGIDITNTTGTVSFDVTGTTSVTSPSNEGIRLSSNTGTATFTFDDVNISGVNGNTGFLASSSGTLTVANGAGFAGTVSTTNGTAVDITSTTIGASGVTFKSVSASGGTNGIVLSSTGDTGGGFTVTGTGTAGTGGVITGTGSMVAGIDISSANDISLSDMTLTNANQVDGGVATCSGSNFTTCNGAIKLDTVIDIEIVNLALTGSEEHGIFGTDVTDFDLSNSTIQNVGNAVNEHGMFFDGLFGTTAAGTASSITNTTITNSENHNVFIRNDAATNAHPGNPDLLVVSGGTTISVLSAPNGANGLLHEAVGTASNMSLDISNTTFEDNRGIGLNLQASQGGHNDLSVTGSTFNSTTGTAPDQDQGMVMVATQASTITFDIFTGNTFDTSDQSAIGVTGNGTASFIGTIEGNTLNPGSALPGSGGGQGINVLLSQGSTGVIDIDGNTINTSRFGRGISLFTRQGNGSLDVTVSNNTITPDGANMSGDGIFAASGNVSGGETNRLCIHYDSNTSAGGSGRDGYQLEQPVNTTFEIEGLNVSGTSFTAVEGFVVSQNTSGSADVQEALATFFQVNYTAPSSPATCATP